MNTNNLTNRELGLLATSARMKRLTELAEAVYAVKKSAQWEYRKAQPQWPGESAKPSRLTDWE